MGRDTQTGTHRAFLSENLQLPFLADSTGQWSTIRKPVCTGLSSVKTSSCLFWRARPGSGVRYENRDTKTGMHRAFLSENLQLPFLAGSTGQWSTIRKPVCTRLSSAKTVNCFLRTRPGTGMRYANRSAFPHPPAGRFFSCPPGFFRFPAFFCHSHIDIYLCIQHTLI